MNADSPVRGGGLAAAVVRLSGLWILAGALGKLFFGTPKLLPPVVIDLTPWTLTFTFQVVIGVEIVIAALAFLKPKAAWPVMVGMMLFFDWILTRTIAGGEESCGCFGGGIDVSPWFMLVVDSAVLVALLVTMPWKRIKKHGAPWWWMAPVLAIAVLAPWLKINAGGSKAVNPQPPIQEPPQADPTNGDPGVKGPVPEPPAVTVDVDWVEFDPKDWIDQVIYDVTDLTNYVDMGLLPTDGKILLWRQGCDHCAEHMRVMAQNDPGDVQIVLVQIQDDLQDGRSVDLMPQGPHVTELQFPAGLEFLLQTPWEIVVEGGMVTQALDPEELEGD